MDSLVDIGLRNALFALPFALVALLAGRFLRRPALTHTLWLLVLLKLVTPPLVDYPEAEIRYYAEEHCLADFPGPPPLDLGDVAEVMAGYGPTTVNLHDVFHVVEDGVVTDIWPVTPRGPVVLCWEG